MENLYRLKEHSGLDLRRTVYKNIPLLFQITFALDGFYQEPSSQGTAPPTWNPIFLHYVYGIFDPYMRGFLHDKDPNPGENGLYEPWNGVNGLERTKYFLNLVQRVMEEENYHIKEEPPEDVILVGDGYPDFIMSTHFITTREMITHKTIIIGFFHLKTRTYQRYLIKDVKKVCGLLRVFNGDFKRLLGISTKPIPHKRILYSKEYNKSLTKEELDKRLYQLISDASSIPITNEHILEMLKVLKKDKDNIYYFPVIKN